MASRRFINFPDGAVDVSAIPSAVSLASRGTYLHLFTRYNILCYICGQGRGICEKTHYSIDKKLIICLRIMILLLCGFININVSYGLCL